MATTNTQNHVRKESQSPNGNGHTCLMSLNKEESQAIEMLRKHPRLGSPLMIVTLGQITVWGLQTVYSTAPSLLPSL